MGETDKQRDLVPTGSDRTDGSDALVATEPHDAEIERIRASIEITRGKISHALDEVQDGVQDKLAWREWVKDHPYRSIGIAFGIGYLLGRV